MFASLALLSLLKTGAESKNAPGAHRSVSRAGGYSTARPAGRECIQVAAETPE